MYIAEVRLISALMQFDRLYSYYYDAFLTAGTVVAIPFGNTNRHQYGIVISSKESEKTDDLKKILFTLPDLYSLTPTQIGAAEFISEQFFCSFGDAARLMLPTGLDIDTAEYLVKGESFDSMEDCDIKAVIEKEGRYNIPNTDFKKSVAKYIRSNKLALVTEALCHINEKKEKFIKLKTFDSIDEALKGSKQKEKYKKVLEHLKGCEEVSLRNLEETYSITSASISFLEKRGLVETVLHSVERTPYSIPEKPTPVEIKLSEEQQKAYDSLEESLVSPQAAAALLYGVTGSGKTSVILTLIDKALSLGKGVIMLVPEIALTSQSAEVLFSRYANRVAIIHSGMSKGERHDSWQAIKSGKKDIVLGTRSAIFAPIKNLGLLIIDEEQDDSFKSDTTPRYHARDVARYLCAKSSALMLLSSATPDLTSFYNATTGKYKLITLKNRYGNATLPDVVVSDMMIDGADTPDKLLGNQLVSALSETLDKGEQAVLFVNRRGLRKLLTCRDCRTPVTCPNCSVSMTLHKKGDGYKLMCHYCGYSMDPPLTCPTCSSKHMQYRGYGTQKLEEELKKLFPEAKVLRLDADTTQKKLSHDSIIADFENHKADILIGTQMVAKGHNFPNVTLVGVVMADLSLFSSDYRANEHTFSLMTQVVGRAGRSKKKGKALLQTMNPYNEIIELCTTQDYNSFFEGEIALRRSLVFPPFCTIGAFYLTSDSEDSLIKTCDELGKFVDKKLKEKYTDVKIIAYGPFEAVPYKLKNTYRKKLVVKFKNNASTRALFKEMILEFNKKDGVRCYFDVSPTLV